MNEVMDVILKRSTIRAYSPELPTEEEISALKQAALASPTAMNRQDQRFIFVTDPELIKALDEAIIQSIVDSGNADFAERIKSRGGKPTYSAPLVVVICGKPSHYMRVDAGIAVENLALAAKSLGLDSVILGMPEGAFAGERGAEMRKRFRFPDGFEYGIAIAIGRRAMDKEPHKWNEEHIIEI